MEKEVEVNVKNVKIDKEKSIIRLKNAPLTAVKTEAGYVITFGKNMVYKEKFKTIREIEDFLIKPKNIYTIIPIMSYIYFNEINKMNNDKTK
nr:MAG TPA: hypothetical protein [Microviridae sp.]